MKKFQIFLIAGLLVAVGMAYRQLHEIETNSALARTTLAVSATSAMPLAPIEKSSAKVGEKPISASEAFIASVKNEADAMSQLNDRPEEVQKRLKDLVDKMQESDIPALQATALNIAIVGDQRFLSVYILGESTLTKAQESLEIIATAPIPAMHEARLTNQEEIIRSQAVESLRQPESLKRVLAHIDNTFIAERAQRSLHYREGKVSSAPAQQDQQALSQLLKKTTR